MTKEISSNTFKLRWKPLKNTIFYGDIMTKEIKSIYGDDYEVTNKYSVEETGVDSCGDCFSCRNMCKTGEEFVYSYTNFGGA